MNSKTSKQAAIGLALIATLAALQSAVCEVTLYNPSFDDGSGNDADNWTENTLDKAARQTWGTHDEGGGPGYTNLMSLTAFNAGTYAEFYQDITNIVPGNIYSLSFWHEGEPAWSGSNVTARFIWIDGDSASIDSTAMDLDDHTLLSGWTNRVLDGVAPNHAKILRVQFDAQCPGTTAGATKLDDMSLTEWPGLYNPGFAVEGDAFSDADRWIENSIDGAARQDWGSHDGDGFMMSLPSYSIATYGEFYQVVGGVTPGHIYSLSFWQTGDANWTGSNATARLIWLNSTSNTIDSATMSLDAWTLDGAGWTNHILKGQAPLAAASIRVQFDAQSPVSSPGGAVKIDELTLTNVAPHGTLLLLR
ncbi:MAG: hypothetical protein HQ523_14515 [Lentisphaerae bacterium]|nr:hypothetical protein [Lentisphaerota bacterium]